MFPTNKGFLPCALSATTFLFLYYSIWFSRALISPLTEWGRAAAFIVGVCFWYVGMKEVILPSFETAKQVSKR